MVIYFSFSDLQASDGKIIRKIVPEGQLQKNIFYFQFHGQTLTIFWQRWFQHHRLDYGQTLTIFWRWWFQHRRLVHGITASYKGLARIRNCLFSRHIVMTRTSFLKYFYLLVCFLKFFGVAVESYVFKLIINLLKTDILISKKPVNL